MMKASRWDWRMKRRASKDLVFCHNDLSTHNIIVDPDTLAITAIVDWEYGGFYTREFEGKYYLRPGPSVALAGETADEDWLLSILEKNKE
ncbi:hypothetical protein MRB53_038492 [Persea americana]|nr:hypothetical protein MRB53_038492 [Persea americana]